MDNQGKGFAFFGQGWSYPEPIHRINRESGNGSAEQDIRESLTILLTTSPGERAGDPGFGCGLQRRTDAQLNGAMLARLREQITRAVLLFEPRITLHRVTFELDSKFDGQLDIRLDYTVIITNTRSNMIFPFHFRQDPLSG